HGTLSPPDLVSSRPSAGPFTKSRPGGGQSRVTPDLTGSCQNGKRSARAPCSPEERTQRDMLRSLPEMYGYLTDPASDDRSRRTALAWFRSAWPQLSARLADLAAEGENAQAVALAGTVVHFLRALWDWAGMTAASRIGLDAAGLGSGG